VKAKRCRICLGRKTRHHARAHLRAQAGAQALQGVRRQQHLRAWAGAPRARSAAAAASASTGAGAQQVQGVRLREGRCGYTGWRGSEKAAAALSRLRLRRRARRQRQRRGSVVSECAAGAEPCPCPCLSFQFGEYFLSFLTRCSKKHRGPRPWPRPEPVWGGARPLGGLSVLSYSVVINSADAAHAVLTARDRSSTL
jgi:hypothetical protein